MSDRGRVAVESIFIMVVSSSVSYEKYVSTAKKRLRSIAQTTLGANSAIVKLARTFHKKVFQQIIEVAQ
jgi:hypothetical protein